MPALGGPNTEWTNSTYNHHNSSVTNEFTLHSCS